MARIKISKGWAVCLPLVLAATAAADQGAPGETTPGQPPQQQGPMAIEKVKSGFVAAADVKATEIDDQFGSLVGGYAGWLDDERLLVGGAGYWLANGDDSLKMAYGGLLVGWTVNPRGRISFGGRGLVGAGQATLAADFPVRVLATSTGGRTPTTLWRSVAFDEDFFIFEPQATMVVRVTDSMHLDWSVGYRLIGAASGLEDRLHGATGSVAIRFGGGR